MNRVDFITAVDEALKARYREIASELGYWCDACGTTALPDRNEHAVCGYCGRTPEPADVAPAIWTWRPESNGATFERNGRDAGSLALLVDLATPTLTFGRIAAVLNRDGQP